MKITIDIKDCRECPFFKITGTSSTDGFDRGEDWYCDKAKKPIASFVEWNERPEIPKWCPAKTIKNKKP